MNDEALLKMIWYCGVEGHEHTSWEDADDCNQMYPLLEQLKLETIRMAAAWLEFVKVLQRDLPQDGSTELDESCQQLYQTLCLEYEAAGQPLGQGEDAVDRWVRQLLEKRQ